jgi:hypothetical protein
MKINKKEKECLMKMAEGERSLSGLLCDERMRREKMFSNQSTIKRKRPWDKSKFEPETKIRKKEKKFIDELKFVDVGNIELSKSNISTHFPIRVKIVGSILNVYGDEFSYDHIRQPNKINNLNPDGEIIRQLYINNFYDEMDFKISCVTLEKDSSFTLSKKFISLNGIKINVSKGSDFTLEKCELEKIEAHVYEGGSIFGNGTTSVSGEFILNSGGSVWDFIITGNLSKKINKHSGAIKIVSTKECEVVNVTPDPPPVINIYKLSN